MWEALTDSQRNEIAAIHPDWAPPRAARDAAGNVLLANGSGEDFLYMNRQTIARTNAMLAAAGHPHVTSWTVLPRPDDADYPVTDFPIFTPQKTPEFWAKNMVSWEARYNDPAYLRRVSLGHLGAEIEFGIHNAAHHRWKEESRAGYRPAAALAGPADPRWNVPEYDFLGDTYSSHVNPVFWKLHGWIDDRIGAWARANNLAFIPWRAPWTGALPPHGGGGLQPMRQIAATLAAAGYTGFFDVFTELPSA